MYFVGKRYDVQNLNFDVQNLNILLLGFLKFFESGNILYIFGQI
jgi:hypothetical protein